MEQLVLDDVTKQYGDVMAVQDMNIAATDGEFISLVGPSGCGKSTTLEMIGGLTTPTDGKVFIDGEDVTDFAPKDRDIAMVFQNIALFPHMDVYDNISYGLRLQSRPKEEIDRRVDEAVEILKLEEMLERMPVELSGGQRQRVAIGRAIVRDPSVFLMDEPLANLDAKLRVHMRTELQRIQRELDVTTVYVTHDQEEAMTMSDRIAVIDGGELQQIAPPGVCYEQPANIFVAGFIGSPGMNFFTAQATDHGIEAGRFRLDIDMAPYDDIESGTEMTVGIRPEDVYFAETGIKSGSNALTTTVDVIEPVGHETFVYLVPQDESGLSNAAANTEDDSAPAQSNEVLLRTDETVDMSEGSELKVVFDRRNLHLFDGASGDAVAHGIGRTANQPVENA